MNAFTRASLGPLKDKLGQKKFPPIFCLAEQGQLKKERKTQGFVFESKYIGKMEQETEVWSRFFKRKTSQL